MSPIARFQDAKCPAYTLAFCAALTTITFTLSGASHAQDDDESAPLEYTLEVVDEGTSEFEIEAEGFNVDAIETYDFKIKSTTLNQLLQRSPGVNVRQQGGMGSETTYSLAGMSGDSVRFFIDGVPMEYFGESYSANNIPPSLLSRVDIYKGVVPVELGTDSLAGAINLVTNPTGEETYLDLSQSIGSFDTYQTTVQGGIHDSESGYFARLDLFHNQSENDYEVWGDGVRYRDGFTWVEFTESNPAKRFNDDFETTNVKLDLGIQNQPWADEFSVGYVTSDLEKGLQHGASVLAVYGEVRIEEDFNFPYLIHRMSDWGWRGLSTNLFVGRSDKETLTEDLSDQDYDWSGNSIDSGPGELADFRPIYRTLVDETDILRLNSAFNLTDFHSLGINLTYTDATRYGRNPLPQDQAELERQGLTKTFLGFALESSWLQDTLTTNVFVKHYDYDASVNTDEYDTSDEDGLIGSQVLANRTEQSHLGGGFAAAYDWSDTLRLKLSIENAVRMPTAEEALGDGINYLPSPSLEPEKSTNLNLGFQKIYELDDSHSFQFDGTFVYRETTEQIVATLVSLQAPGFRYDNIDDVKTDGVELAMTYSYEDFLTISANATILDIRNDTPFNDITNRENILFGDRLPNIPYEFFNVSVSADFYDWFQSGSKINTYWNITHINEYFLHWPSLGDQGTKRTIPTQTSHDVGVSYTFPDESLSIAFDINNLFDEQVFDNWRLQKPGRALFLKVSYSY
ncbi:MAG: TonB-dependent receptor plug domain-containing protein [Pseudomonadota bacterium]